MKKIHSCVYVKPEAAEDEEDMEVKMKSDKHIASLGDLITLSLLSWIASLLFADIEEDRWLSTTIIATYVLFTPVCIYFAKKHASTIDVLYYGWTPVLLA